MTLVTDLLGSFVNNKYSDRLGKVRAVWLSAAGNLYLLVQYEDGTLEEGIADNKWKMDMGDGRPQ